MSNYSENIPDLEAENTSWTKIINYVPENSLVLDVGSSNGQLGLALKQNKNCVVYGTEIDQGDYNIAKKNLDKVFLFNIETDQLPKELASKRFDVIIFADVIEHLINPAQTLRTVKNILKDNGRIVFSIPNMAHISVRLQLLSGHFSYNKIGLLDKTHIHFYDFEEVQRIMAEAELQVAEYDSNILNYSPTFLKQKLNKLGLSDNGFIAKMQQDIQAQTFQFVGYCIMPSNSNKITNIPLSTTTPEHDLTEYTEKTHSDNLEIRATNKRLADYIKVLEKEKERLNKEIQYLKKTWRGKLAQNVKGIISRRSKKNHDK